ncbi:2-oxoacid:acceptor oxidoreductase family protein [Clostridium sp. D2Q-11]|uniref:2-oxoacid:acceptor oxidoreductase family protein n=1 Tax=Anaeromonas frigoriresistens TaxID=2683708 RepID=A0A942Z7V9_9FIRM|nr:2-oxoacid:acceptor oxidoreductase family protein [Anaeromonas frigoriresistens]MBS4539946.1 2-oxoacid:acceptor oxidoreductase family protein [Anaeromonas frigoriresistens]
MKGQTEVRLSGSGGQGLILAGIILAEAALIDGKNSIQTQSYGPEARGGASKAEVIISDTEINYPKVRKCDVLLSLTQKSCDEYLDSLKKNGILIIDKDVEKPERTDVKIFHVPIIEKAVNNIGISMVANIVALGAINGITKIVSEEALKEAILKRVPPGTEKVNEKAYEQGLNII